MALSELLQLEQVMPVIVEVGDRHLIRRDQAMVSSGREGDAVSGQLQIRMDRPRLHPNVVGA